MAHRRVADQVGERRQRRYGLLHHRRICHVRMARHGADHEVAALELNAVEAFDPVEIDDVPRRGEPLFHYRQQALSAGEQLCLLELAEHVRRLAQPARAVIGETVHASVLRFSDACQPPIRPSPWRLPRST
jgi:hypothetical protein